MNRITTVALALLLSSSASGLAQSAAVGAGTAAAREGLSARSYAKAHAVLSAALQAYGGVDVVRGVDDIEVVIAGERVARNESAKVEPPFTRRPTEGTLLADLRRQRYVYEERNPQLGLLRIVISAGEVFFIDPAERTVEAGDAANVPTMTFNFLRHLPPLLLVHVLEKRAATLRYLGQEPFDGRPHDVVTFAAAHGAQLALFLDSRTHLLSKTEHMVSDVHDGDSVQEALYGAHRAVGGIQMPAGRLTRRNGELLEEVEYTQVRFDTRPDDAVFAKPAGYKEAPVTPSDETRETKLAEGVYLFESGVNSLVVEFADHVMVVEPHIGGRGPKATMERAREMFPGKPIRYVVITHHHFDHSGGMRSYVAAGVSLVTTPANRRFLETMAAGTFTIAPDDQSKARRAPLFTFVERGKRVFSDGTQTVEVIDIGPNPHAEEMLVVYVPKAKLVFQGDLLRLPADGTYPDRAIDDATVQFDEALARLGLPVERIAAVHGPVTTLTALRAAIAKDRQEKERRGQER